MSPDFALPFRSAFLRLNGVFRNLCVRAASVLVVAALGAASALAQSSATLTGTVTDPSGAAIAGAKISAQPLGGGEPFSATTDSAGRYTLTLPAGRYRLRLAPAVQGALAPIERDVMLAAGESRDLSDHLAIAELSERVVVTAHSEPLSAEETPASVSILTSKNIEQRQDVWLEPLLSSVPGVVIGRNGRQGGLSSIFVNGGNSNFTKVLVDGATLNEPGGAIVLSDFSLENVEKVEIVRGAESALYGTDAMTGVIQVFTRRGTTRRPLLHLLAEGGKYSTAHGAADLSGATGNFDYSAAASRFDTDGQEPNDNIRNTTLSGNFGYAFSDTNRVRLALRSAASHAGSPGQTLYTPGPNMDQYIALRNFTANLGWDFATGQQWQHRVAASETYIRQLFDNATSDFCDPNPPFICDFPSTTRNQYNRAGFIAQSSYLRPNAAVTFGYQMEVENGNIARGHVRRNNNGGYMDARWSWQRLMLTGGFRVEGNDSFGVRAVPRVGAAYLLRKGGGTWGATRLRGTFGLGVKEPSFIQTFGFSTDPCFPGNPDLKPERSRTATFGIEQRLADDRVKITAEGFLNRFRDMTSFTFCVPGGPCPVTPPAGCPFGFGAYFNTDLARANGMNLSFESRPARWLMLGGAYTYTDSRVLDSPNAFDPALVPGQRLLRRPANAGNIFLAVTAGRFGGSLAGYFYGRRTDSDFLGLGFTSNAGYARFDLSMSYAVARFVSAFGRVDNLFDKRYQENLGYQAYRRMYRLGLKFTVGGE